MKCNCFKASACLVDLLMAVNNIFKQHLSLIRVKASEMLSKCVLGVLLSFYNIIHLSLSSSTTDNELTKSNFRNDFSET